MKILLSGLAPEFDIEVLRARLAHFGPVVGIHAIRHGDSQRPWAVVEMDLGLAATAELARRIDGVPHVDGLVRAQVLLRV